ncbi:MAG: copper chaperone [Planctomycetota bacterium]|nr:MAG: copper chaperone [Planctomycetota bacterium]
MHFPLIRFTAALLLLTGCSGSDVSKPATIASSARTTQVAYTVTGMHCNACAEAITAELTAVKGVNSVQCTFESKCAVVELSDPGAQGNAEHAITKLGYTIVPCVVPTAAPIQAAPVQPADPASSK